MKVNVQEIKKSIDEHPLVKAVFEIVLSVTIEASDAYRRRKREIARQFFIEDRSIRDLAEEYAVSEAQIRTTIIDAIKNIPHWKSSLHDLFCKGLKYDDQVDMTSTVERVFLTEFYNHNPVMGHLSKEFLLTPISKVPDLDISIKTALKNYSDVEIVYDMLQLSLDDYSKIKQIGKKKLNLLREFIEKNEIELPL